MKAIEMTSRYDPIEIGVTCCITILRDDKWYQLRPFQAPLKKAKEIISRLRRKGRTIKVTWFEGLG